MKTCRFCGDNIHEFLDFGKQPIANAFIPPEQVGGDEYFFGMRLAFCPSCFLVQLVEQPSREMMFHENYAYFSSISRYMAEHFRRFALMVMDSYIDDDPLVVEIGSNDGIMLRNFAEAGVPSLGVEPSANVAEAARSRGIETICEFFDKDLAERIRSEKGEADAVLAANVMCHIPYLDSVFEGVTALLKPAGVLIFEDPYWGDILEKTSYDQIYDEHVFYFSLTAVSFLAERYGLEVIDVQPQPVHGGEMRYIIARKGAHKVSGMVEALREKEKRMRMGDLERMREFADSVARSRDDLIRTLTDLKKQGKRVAGYGATSKSTTVINYCGITTDLVEYISDTTPSKQGRFSPGAHIPIKPYEEFAAAYPDVALLFAWNHAEEIMKKERRFMEAGGRWLKYVPKVEIS
ncbi:MAG: methyltransferase domain-containing protein [Candidatus Nitrospinota bacterium M3_3B_026]